MEKRYGYKGVYTSLNGLTNWLLNNFNFHGTPQKQRESACQMIIKYGEANIPGYKKYGHLEIAADYVATKIKRNNKFEDFKKWISITYNPIN